MIVTAKQFSIASVICRVVYKKLYHWYCLLNIRESETNFSILVMLVFSPSPVFEPHLTPLIFSSNRLNYLTPLQFFYMKRIKKMEHRNQIVLIMWREHSPKEVCPHNFLQKNHYMLSYWYEIHSIYNRIAEWTMNVGDQWF